MELVQTFETTLSDRESGLTLHFITIPARSLADPKVLEHPEELEAVMIAAGPNAASLLPALFAFALTEQGDVLRFPYFNETRWEALEALLRRQIPEPLYAFTVQTAFARVVPFEESPLNLESLASLLASGSKATVGSAVGFLAAGGPSPLLLVTVPAGIVLVGAATAFTQGLRHKILKWMDVPTETATGERPTR